MRMKPSASKWHHSNHSCLSFVGNIGRKKMSCFRFLKGMMFIFNGIIFVAGIVILAIGVWVKVDSSSFLKILTIKSGGPEPDINVGYLCIALAFSLMIVGFLGCWGALKENKALLMLFFVIVLLIFIVEVTGGVVVLAFSSLAEIIVEGIGVEAKKSIKTDYGKNTDITKVWDSLMTELKCCGFTNYNDFTGSPFHISTSNYPPVCCTNSTSCIQADAMLSKINGCYLSLLRFLKDHSIVLGGVAMGIAALELAALVVSMVLFCKITPR
ncbi:LOW QUALITY PROTEIN: tetraspanin 35 [Erpetoichthys calabaricus]|uniref:LOW QUALITY PROTEIN: tetraspanin 35 n=1 Tax=Erpetoichthys calabaricus TaxID=27687 RepID=UPI002234BED2|nr:LOW QUALITY PROTEIN: tetraspanin 35 [Erpetoichthys calabaricus]